MPVRLASYRERGVLRRFRASAMPIWAILGSQIAIALLPAAEGAVSITVARTLIHGTELLPSNGLHFTTQSPGLTGHRVATPMSGDEPLG